MEKERFTREKEQGIARREETRRIMNGGKLGVTAIEVREVIIEATFAMIGGEGGRERAFRGQGVSGTVVWASVTR